MQDADRTYLDDTSARCVRRDGMGRSASRIPSVAVVVSILTSVAGGADPARPAIAETVVRLHPTAVVQSDRITLTDIAEITGPEAERFADWLIARHLQAGDSYVVKQEYLQTYLSKRGVNLSSWVFRGSTRCKVERPGEPRPRRDRSHPKKTVRPEPKVKSPPRPEPHRIDPNSLEAALREHLARKLADLGGTPEVEFRSVSDRLLALSKPTYAFRITDQAERRLGMVPLDVTIFEGERVQQQIRVLAAVKLNRPVVVAVRPLNRGQVIRAGDLALQPRTFKQVGDIGLTRVEPLVGQRARRFIDRGRRLGPRDIEPVPLVKRGDLAEVIVQRGNLRIQCVAKVLEEGGYGDVIELRRANTRSTFLAIVTGPGRVELPPSGPGVTTTQPALADGRR